MYRGKHSPKRRSRWNKSAAMLVSLLLVFTMALGGTLAYIFTGTEDVLNTFTISKVTTAVEETIEGGVKKNVKIQNTGDTDAYIRATVVVTWQDDEGNVYGQKPVTNMECDHIDCECDYAIEFNTETQQNPNGKWIQNGDFYYWNKAVKSDDDAPENCSTGILIKNCRYFGNAPADYSLCVEIIGSGIQADGMGKDEDGKPAKPVVLAWGVDPEELKEEVK